MALLLAAAIALLRPATVACGDGGVVVASHEAAGRRVTVFVAPAVPRVGVIEVSILRSPTTSDPSPITVVATRERGGVDRRAIASRAENGNRLFDSALLDLPFDGAWRVEVHCGGAWPSPSFEIEVAPALPPWRSQWPWLFAWVPLTALLLLRDRMARRGTIGA